MYKRIVKHISDLECNSHHSPKMQNSWNKYGADQFEIEVLQDVKEERLIHIEQIWIDVIKPNFNICKIAGRRVGYVESEETRRRKSEALRGKKRTPEQIENIRRSQLGKTLSEEHRAKCGRKGTPKPEGFGEKIRAARTGTKMSPEAVENMAKTKRKEYVFTDPNGCEHTAIGLRKFCREHGLSPSSMSAIASGRPHYLEHRGWKCRYREDNETPASADTY